MAANTQAIVLFDGVCNLCSNSVQFVIKREPAGHIQFASLQSAIAQELLLPFPAVSAEELHSMVVIEYGKVYTRSTAALRITRHLKGAWPLLYALMIIPRFIRDSVYNYIATHRYQWFGKKDACWVPTPELKGRFLG